MIYRPVSSGGLVTMPKEAREFLQLDTLYDDFVIEQAGMYQARIYTTTEPTTKRKRKLSNKGQFTIPATIRRSWGVYGPHEVSFYIQEPYLIMSLAGPEKPCDLCNETGLLFGAPCVICQGTTKTRRSPMGVTGELGEVMRIARKYGIGIHIKGTDKGCPKVEVYVNADLPDQYGTAIANYFNTRFAQEHGKVEDEVQDKKFRNIVTGKIVLASQVGRDFYLEAWSEQKKAGAIPEDSGDYEKPHELPIAEYIDQGCYLLSENEEYEPVE